MISCSLFCIILLRVEEERFKELELHSSQEHGQRLSDINEMIDSITDQINKKISESNNIAESIPQLAAKVYTLTLHEIIDELCNYCTKLTRVLNYRGPN